MAKTTNHKSVFTQVSPKEIKLEYRDNKFILKEMNQGVYGMGSAVMLYKQDGLERKFLQNIGWTAKDGGYDSHLKGNSFLGKGLFNIEQIKIGAMKFIDAMLD